MHIILFGVNIYYVMLRASGKTASAKINYFTLSLLLLDYIFFHFKSLSGLHHVTRFHSQSIAFRLLISNFEVSESNIVITNISYSEVVIVVHSTAL